MFIIQSLLDLTSHYQLKYYVIGSLRTDRIDEFIINSL
jgi:hypothetical protein